MWCRKMWYGWIRGAILRQGVSLFPYCANGCRKVRQQQRFCKRVILVNEVNNLKRTIIKFLMYFFAFFIGNLILNAVFKDDLNIGTAFSVVLGFSTDLAFIGYFVEKKMNKKWRINMIDGQNCSWWLFKRFYPLFSLPLCIGLSLRVIM